MNTFSHIYMHNENSQAEDDNGLGRKRGKALVTSSHIDMHTKNLQAKVDNRLGGNGEKNWSLPVIHACTHKTQLTY